MNKESKESNARDKPFTHQYEMKLLSGFGFTMHVMSWRYNNWILSLGLLLIGWQFSRRAGGSLIGKYSHLEILSGTQPAGMKHNKLEKSHRII